VETTGAERFILEKAYLRSWERGKLEDGVGGFERGGARGATKVKKARSWVAAVSGSDENEEDHHWPKSFYRDRWANGNCAKFA